MVTVVPPLFMIRRFLIRQTLVALFLLAKSEIAGAQVTRMPDLRIDPSPVVSTGAGAIASYADVVEPAQQTVVSIFSSKLVKPRLPTNPLFRRYFGEDYGGAHDEKEEGLGSGVVVSASGHILTNSHVVEGADEMKVTLTDGREFPAQLIGADPKTDIAVIKIAAENLPFITLANSDNLRVGDIVFAVGNPLGVGQTVTMGIVSATGRNQLRLLENVAGYENFIQTDAAINMGNSGGALIDAKGRLVGINSAILSPSRGNIGIGFAIPVNFAAAVMRSLIETGTVSRGYLGVSSETLTAAVAEQLGLGKQTRGVAITDVSPGGPAEKAGLKISDVILAINSAPVISLEGLRLAIAQMAPHSTVRLRVVRDTKEQLIEVKLGELADKPSELFSGIRVEQVSDAVRRRNGLGPSVTGLLVMDVDENSAYSDRFASGMVIAEINQRKVSDVASAKRALITPGGNLIRVHYRGMYAFVTMELK